MLDVIFGIVLGWCFFGFFFVGIVVLNDEQVVIVVVMMKSIEVMSLHASLDNANLVFQSCSRLAIMNGGSSHGYY